MIFGAGLPSISVTRMLDGFKSRWMMAFWCACWTAFADVHEQFQPFASVESVLVAIVGNRDTGDVLHDEVRRALRRGAGIEHLGDGRMVHQSQSLALGFKARDHFAACPSRLSPA